MPGLWAATIDGNDNVWISNFAAPNSPIVELCGVRTENCPPGMKTGDQISPPDGYVSAAVCECRPISRSDRQATIDSCFGIPEEVLSTRCGGQGVVIFYGMAKPVRAPQIGPARQP